MRPVPGRGLDRPQRKIADEATSPHPGQRMRAGGVLMGVLMFVSVLDSVLVGVLTA